MEVPPPAQRWRHAHPPVKPLRPKQLDADAPVLRPPPRPFARAAPSVDQRETAMPQGRLPTRMAPTTRGVGAHLQRCRRGRGRGDGRRRRGRRDGRTRLGAPAAAVDHDVRRARQAVDGHAHVAGRPAGPQRVRTGRRVSDTETTLAFPAAATCDVPAPSPCPAAPATGAGCPAAIDASVAPKLRRRKHPVGISPTRLDRPDERV